MYQYLLENCDVLDKEKLQHFREKRIEWINWLNGDDRHSIWRQITQLLWNYVFFLTINDLRDLAAQQPAASVGFNGEVLRLLDIGFVTDQVTTIRRLTEYQPIDVKKSVISLRSIAQDIQDNHELITREVYVAYDGLPYDPEPVKQAHFDKMCESTVNGQISNWLETAGPNAWSASEMAHENFDKLCNKLNSTRNRTDVLSIGWHGLVKSKLDECNDVRKFADKFIAHAADPNNRAELTESQTGITLNQLGKCHKALYQVAAFISGSLLCESSHGALPTPQFNHLENLDKGWVTKDGLKRARESFDKHVSVIEIWESESLWPDITTSHD